MKRIILASLFIVFSLFARAQLNQSQSQITQLMSNDSTWKFDGLGHDKDGYPVLSYQSKEKNWTKAFCFNKNDSCLVIKLTIPSEQLKAVVKDMNKRYRFVSNAGYVWSDDKEKVFYFIKSTDNNPFFEVYNVSQSMKIWIR